MTDQSISTAALMRKVAEGDQGAFRLLARALSGPMHRQAIALVGGQGTIAEDAVQNALIKLWQAAPRWQPLLPGQSVEAYARTIVKNCCIDLIRADNRRPTGVLEDDDVAANDDIAADVAARHDVDAAIVQLVPRQQQAVRDYYLRGESQRDVAASMGTTEKGVERMLAGARTRMRRFLDGGDKGPKSED